MAINYVKMVNDLIAERELWRRKRSEADQNLMRVTELIKSAVKMLPPDHKFGGDLIVDHYDNRPVGLTAAIRTALTDAGKEWMTPIEIRDYLQSISFDFEHYKTNPLASIHSTLKRLMPDEVEAKKFAGDKKAYKIKR